MQSAYMLSRWNSVCPMHSSVKIVYVEWEKMWSHVNFVTIFGDSYQIKLCGISNNFNQFTYLKSVSWVNSDVIKTAAIALLIRIYVYWSMLARQSFFIGFSARALDC